MSKDTKTRANGSRKDCGEESYPLLNSALSLNRTDNWHSWETLHICYMYDTTIPVRVEQLIIYRSLKSVIRGKFIMLIANTLQH